MAISICFREEHLAQFSEASLDFNAFHLSADYARLTPYGERVVHGVLGALACLGEVDLPRGRVVSAVEVEYRAPMLLGVEYRIVVREHSAGSALVVVMDGSTLVVRMRLEMGEGAGAMLELTEGAVAGLTIARETDMRTLPAGTVFTGAYSPPRAAYLRLLKLLELDRSRLGDALLITLLFSSYATGMEVPGERGMAVSLRAEFADSASALPYRYEIVFGLYDERFGTAESEFRIGNESGNVAKGQIRSMERPTRPLVEQPVSGLVPDRLRGKTALIIGASRGLGAAMALELAASGCRVIASFAHSAADASTLLTAARRYPGEIVLEQGDASEQVWCREVRSRILQTYGGLDLLICNAAPAIHSMRLEEAFGDRIAAYVERGFALVAVPLAGFLDMLNAAGGSVLLISSSAVESPPRMWPHYVAMKCAVEGLVCAAAAGYPKISFRIARPGKLRTDLTNTTRGRDDAEAPNAAARRILADLGEPGQPRGVQYVK